MLHFPISIMSISCGHGNGQQDGEKLLLEWSEFCQFPVLCGQLYSFQYEGNL